MRLNRPFVALIVLALFAGQAQAVGSAGAYLAGRHASFQSDYAEAADYYARAISLDPANAALMENAISAYVNLGEIERAFPIAQRMVDGGMNSQVAALVLLAEQVDQEKFDQILSQIADGRDLGGLVDGLAKAWVLMGSGQVSEAMAAFDAVIAEDGLKAYGLYHKALAFASVGDFESADGIFSGRASGPLEVTRRGVIAHAEILSQLDRDDEALDLIKAAFERSPAPMFDALIDRLDAGETLPFDIVTNAREGMAEVFHSIGGALVGETAPGYSLLYARIAEYLNPGNIEAVLLSASLLETLEQYDLATQSYDEVPADDPAYPAAEMGRADALEAAGRVDEAVEGLRALTKSHSDLIVAHISLGDMLRRHERFEEAIPAYDDALAVVGEDLQPQHWIVLFSRGIAYERTDRWREAEADFRKALELRPDQPQVLNYLGYSLLEQGRDLDEALNMIETAVAARSDDAFITDSLGWALYRLGRYAEAVAPMERAVELYAVDPIINDHLGDVYWAVGRQLEAQFQWHRALSFDPEAEDAARIRRKLELGLDAVLEDEGAEPLAAAQDG